MNEDERKYLTLAARKDLAAFIPQAFPIVSPGDEYLDNWHIEAIAWELQQAFAGNTRRLVISLPPRNLKSICASVIYPAWVLGQNPSARIACVSYSAELASTHHLNCRALMESDLYRRIFPNTRIGEKNTETKLVTTARGERYATSTTGTITGLGFDIIIIDDPMKPEDAMSDVKRTSTNEWFDRTLLTRLNDKRRGVIILIMQRLHVEDLAGHVLSKSDDWKQLILPAIAEEGQSIQIGVDKFHTRIPGDLLHEQREPRWVLDELRPSLGGYNFSAQYQQCPVPDDGEIIKWKWFQFYDRIPEGGRMIVQSWDTASTANQLSDYSACITAEIKGHLCYITDVLRERLDYPDLRRTVIEHAIKYRADFVIIENKGSGMQLLQEFSRGERGMPTAIPFTPEHDKVTRMYAQTAKIEAGHVLLPYDPPWLPAFKSELLQFPHGKYDDQVDALSQLLAWVGERNRVPFVADFGYGQRATKIALAPALTIKPNILVQRRVEGRSQLVRWDPTEGFGS